MSTDINSRRDFLKQSVYFGIATVAAGPLTKMAHSMKMLTPMRFGLVTYLWGQDWDLPTLIANCEKTGVLGVELRTEHAHGVESNLSAAQRRDVKKRFADSPVELLGPGTNFAFHHADPEKLRRDIQGAKEYIKLSYDCGGTGIKVKPNDLPKDVPHEKTIEQIGKSLNELGRYAAEYDQMIRVEVHGRGTSSLPVIKAPSIRALASAGTAILRTSRARGSNTTSTSSRTVLPTPFTFESLTSATIPTRS